MVGNYRFIYTSSRHKKKGEPLELFWSISHRVQITVLLCLLCEVKKSKTTTKLFENSRSY